MTDNHTAMLTTSDAPRPRPTQAAGDGKRALQAAAPLRAAASKPLRVGIVVDSTAVPAYVGKILTDAATDGCSVLAAVVIGGDAAESPSGAIPSWSRRALSAYERADYRLLRLRPDALQPVQVTDLLPANGGVTVHARGQDGLPAPIFEPVADSLGDDPPLDVIVNLSRREVPEAWSRTVRHGVWTLDLEDADAPLWEAFATRRPAARTCLKVSDRNRGVVTVSETYSKINFGSLYRSRNSALWKTAELVIRKLRDLHQRGAEALAAVECDDATASATANGKRPSLWGMLPRVAGSLCRRGWEELCREESWFIAVNRRVDPQLHRASNPPAITAGPSSDSHFLFPPRGHFYADPFMLEQNDHTYLFFEDFVNAEDKGNLAVVTFDPAEGFSEPTTILELDFHLSYPFVFEWNGEVFMVPETADDKRIVLYRAVEFPHRWTLERVLIDDVTAYDSTLFHTEERWWMFANIKIRGGSSMDELCLFHAETPLGPWTPHPRNPVVSDVRSARPAGRVFEHCGRLIRPSQDCAISYGYAIRFNQIEVLNLREYRETCIGTLTPDCLPGVSATHTYNRSEHYEVMDFKVPLRKAWFAGADNRRRFERLLRGYVS